MSGELTRAILAPIGVARVSFPARRLGLAALAALAVIASSCSAKKTVRYKMTVEVETPQGLRTGHSVRAVTIVTPAPELALPQYASGLF